MNFRNWTTETWTALATVVAFVALVQPWLLSIWRRLFSRGTIDIHPTANIEIGYSGFGATVGLMGTLRARDRDMFVQWARLILVKNLDHSVRQYGWKAFRAPKISVGTAIGQSMEVALELPFSFMVSALQPHRFNIVFSDEALIQAAQPVVQELQQAWINRIQKLNLPTLPGDQTYQQNMKKLRHAFSEFSHDPIYEKTWHVLNALYYWDVGSYQLTLQVQTARPNRIFSQTWSFSLTKIDLANLQNNVFSIFEEICGLPLTAGNYGFAYANYNS